MELKLVPRILGHRNPSERGFATISGNRRGEPVPTSLGVLAGQVPLEEFIDKFAEAEVTAVLNDPFVEVQTIVQNAMPNHPRVRESAKPIGNASFPAGRNSTRPLRTHTD